MHNEEFAGTFLKISLHRMSDLYFIKFEEALKGLTIEDLWREPYDKGNTIGGITLHVCEHIARSCLRLNGLKAQLKTGFENYFPQNECTSTELLQRLETQLAAWSSIMNKYMNNELQINEEHIHELYHLIEHTGYHLGQIIDRIQAAREHKFEFCKNGINEAYLKKKIDQAN